MWSNPGEVKNWYKQKQMKTIFLFHQKSWSTLILFYNWLFWLVCLLLSAQIQRLAELNHQMLCVKNLLADLFLIIWWKQRHSSRRWIPNNDVLVFRHFQHEAQLVYFVYIIHKPGTQNQTWIQMITKNYETSLIIILLISNWLIFEIELVVELLLAGVG